MKSNVKMQVLEEVKKIEKEEQIKVLFLIESGSRGWGWESDDSDYDIRGVFIQDYMLIEDEKKQVDRIIGSLDIVLWDLRKFLKLMMTSNPSVWEWLSSDIVYVEHILREKLRSMFENHFNSQKLKKHYVSMARQNFHKYIKDSGDVANLKKYVYVLRSLACVLWIEKNKSPPPKNYKGVMEFLPEDIRKFFEKIVEDKKESESLMGKRNEEAERFVISFFDREFEEEQDRFNVNELNTIFKSCTN